MLYPKPKLEIENWQRINNRNITHLLGVEFLHNLYNRHLPRINSIRFRNTITIWKDGQANSYAPKKDWAYLNQWLGNKLLLLDDLLIKEVQFYLKNDYSFIKKYLKLLKKKDFAKLSNQDLGIELLNLQDFTLGELYKLNNVQLEFSLNFAISKILSDYQKNEEKKAKLLSEIIGAGVPTASQKEQMQFAKILILGKQLKIKDPTLSKIIMSLLRKHYTKFAYSHCAYGELPPTKEFYYNKYCKEVSSKRTDSPQVTLKKIKLLHTKSQKKLKQLNNNRLTLLVNIMIRLGTLRDQNKAYLGQTVRFRLEILDEIARRNLEERANLDYYLLSEMLDLLDRNVKLSPREIKRRVKQGVTLVRHEYLASGIKVNFITKNDLLTANNIKGICASQGIITGVCKIIMTKGDAHKINKGDIMIAKGTDFDLLEAINLAGGIITEEGGILSHASVVSREMKKPCCIGVKNATSLFRDGMMVKLNATEGLIKII